MSRLIDADKLKVDYIVPSTTTNTACYPYVSYFQIKDAPTVDAVEVVRCKDCKYYWKNSVMTNVPLCLASPKDDAFCSEGKRRDDADT